MRQHETWIEDVKALGREAGWLRAGGTVVAAVSGGPDSMALLHLLKEMAETESLRVVAAHANHQFRGAESDAEGELVRRAASDWGVAFESTSLGMPDYIEETGLNAQSASREKRYAFLRGIADKYGSSYLLTAHHADDQAETVLMRMIRGTGIGGLAGISYRRREDHLELIRPLLRITKCELLEYCKRNGVPYAVDSSNADRHYFRNVIRLDVLPALERYNPRLRDSLARLSEMAAADDNYMEEQAARIFREAATPSGDGFRLERRRFRSLHVALQRRVIKLILNCSANPRQMLDFRLVEEILELLSQERPTTVRVDIGDGWVLSREYDVTYIGPERFETSGFAYSADENTTEIAIPETGGSLRLERLEGAVQGLPGNRNEACFDAEELSYPLLVRSRLAGDAMRPYGLNGTKKVQDMFVDAKVPRSRRDQVPLLADDDGRVLWIPGLRRSDHALVREHTRITLRATYEAEN